MTNVLVTRAFRFASGSLARNVDIGITARGDGTVIQTVHTNNQGTVSVTLPEGSYDWLYQGVRIPFDVDDFVGPPGPPGPAVLITDNGDGTADITVSGTNFTVTDNGDGTADIDLAGDTATVGRTDATVQGIALVNALIYGGN